MNVNEKRQLLTVLEQFSWLTDLEMVEIFVHDVWEKRLPSSLREFVQQLQPHDWSHILRGDISSLRLIPPLSLLCLLQFIRSLPFNRRPPKTPLQLIQYFPSLEIEVGDVFAPTTSANHLRVKIKPKKQHELDRILELVRIVTHNSLKRGTRIERIVDVGAGIGHLSRMIAVQFPELQVEAIEAESAFDERAKSMDSAIKKRVEINEPTRCVKFLKVENGSTDFQAAPAQATLLIGLHSCGDLSSTILRSFVSSPHISSLLLFSCCYHKLSCSGQPNFAKIKSDVPGFPMSSELSSVSLSYAARELACHSIEAFALDLERNDLTGPLSRTYRAVLEQTIMHVDPLQERQQQTRPVAKPYLLEFDEYVKKALRHKPQLSEVILNHLSCPLCSQLISSLSVLSLRILSIHCLRLILAPVIESLIIHDRLAFLRENGCSDALCLPLFDPLISPRNFAIVAFK